MQTECSKTIEKIHDSKQKQYDCLCSNSIYLCTLPYTLSFHRHFLFKTGTGTTPLFSTATPGYTMASGSVYSPPTRPLPRNTLSRSAFKFKKSSKYCSWKCTALCAVGVSVLLAILLSYFIGEFLCFVTVIINRDVRWTVPY